MLQDIYTNVYTCVYTCTNSHVHVLMRDEKEERKKQARSNKATQHTHVHVCGHVHVVLW